MDRHLAWPECANVRDLGGLGTDVGRTTRFGGVVRADSLDRLTPEGWRALERYGVRTTVDLRNEIEREGAPYICPNTDVVVVHAPVEDDTDRDFVERWRPFSTPHYYAAAVARWPDHTAGAVTAVARAGPGAVVVHCGLGRDHTGLVAVLLLALAGVRPAEIAADYACSAARLPLDVDRLLTSASKVNPRSRRQLEDDLATERARRARSSDSDAVLALLASLDVPAWLRAAGGTDGDIAAVRARLL